MSVLGGSKDDARHLQVRAGHFFVMHPMSAIMEP